MVCFESDDRIKRITLIYEHPCSMQIQLGCDTGSFSWAGVWGPHLCPWMDKSPYSIMALTCTSFGLVCLYLAVFGTMSCISWSLYLSCKQLMELGSKKQKVLYHYASFVKRLLLGGVWNLDWICLNLIFKPMV